MARAAFLTAPLVCFMLWILFAVVNLRFTLHNILSRQASLTCPLSLSRRWQITRVLIKPSNNKRNRRNWSVLLVNLHTYVISRCQSQQEGDIRFCIETARDSHRLGREPKVETTADRYTHRTNHYLLCIINGCLRETTADRNLPVLYL
jgi:hypothetical protein